MRKLIIGALMGMAVGIPLGTQIESDYARCGVSVVSWNFASPGNTQVEQNAGFNLLGYPVTPCLGTGVYLPVLDNGIELYVIDATNTPVTIDQRHFY